MIMMKHLMAAPLALSFLLFSATRPLIAEDQQANALLQQGKVDEANSFLDQTLAAQPDDAWAHQLLCRVFYAQDMADNAIKECELAVSDAPGDSSNQVWLGRAFGYKASHASPLIALSLAKKVHNAFERAVELDPANIDALDDLGEYYVAAPAIVGGGLDKAETLAAKMMPSFPARAHRLLALIAEKKKDLAAAENEFKAAVATSKTPEAYIDLGHFYSRQNQSDKILAVLQAGIDADRRKDAALVDAASILTEANLSLPLAENLLRQYLTSPARSDDAPAFKVHLQLGDLLAQHGDIAGAHREYAAAVGLASNYAPARKAIRDRREKAIP